MKIVQGIIVLIIISFLFYSCGASHHLRDESIYNSDDFRFNNLMQNELIIGGISSHVTEISREDRIDYSSMLSNTILEELKDVHTIHIINTMQLVNNIGKENYFKIMDIFDKGIILSDRNIHLIKNSGVEAKYFLVAHIQNENIIDRSSAEYVNEKDGKKSRETTYEKTYLLTIDFQIYDLIQEKLVWSNVIYNQAYQSETRTTQTGCFESCLDNIMNLILFGPPAEISREEVFAEMIERFTENLSETKTG